MKKPEDIVQLNFNDIAFFFGIPSIDAKWVVLNNLNLNPSGLKELINEKTGVPKIGKGDYINKACVERKIKSCSPILEGRPHIDYHIEVYNRGISLTNLREFSENKSFVKALKFTGKYTILNDILNKEQYLRLQKSWVYKNTYRVDRFSKNCLEFIKKNKWAEKYLLSKGINIEGR